MKVAELGREAWGRGPELEEEEVRTEAGGEVQGEDPRKGGWLSHPKPLDWKPGHASNSPENSKSTDPGTSLVVQWVTLWTNTGSPHSIPGQGTRSPGNEVQLRVHMPQIKKKKNPTATTKTQYSQINK